MSTACACEAAPNGSPPNLDYTPIDETSLDQVLYAMRLGDSFYTQGEQSGIVAEVEQYHCWHCQRTYIRSRPDAVTDNNLDNLPRIP
jgi:hypothetical protein